MVNFVGVEMCSTSRNSVCPADQCADAYYNVNGVCMAFNKVEHCDGHVACTTDADSK